MTPSSATTDLLVERLLPRAESAQIYEKTRIFPCDFWLFEYLWIHRLSSTCRQNFRGWIGAYYVRCGFTHWVIGSDGLRGLKRSPWIPSASSSFFSASNRVALGSIKNSAEKMVDENSSKALRWHYVHGKVFLGTQCEGFPGHMVTALNQETVDCRCISSGSLQSLVWDSQMKRVLHTSVYYILECPPNHKAKRTGATWEIQWCLFYVEN